MYYVFERQGCRKVVEGRREGGKGEEKEKQRERAISLPITLSPNVHSSQPWSRLKLEAHDAFFVFHLGTQLLEPSPAAFLGEH